MHVGNPEAFKNFAICNYFVKHGYKIHYFSPFPPKNKHKGIIYHYNDTIKKTKFGILRNIFFLKRLIKDLKPDIVHAHNVAGFGWIAALAGFSPLIVHAYGGDVLPEQTADLKQYQHWLSRYTVKKADQIVVTGRHMIKTVADNFNIDICKISAIPRGIDLQVFKPFPSDAVESLKIKYGVPTDKFILLSPRYLFNSVYNIDIILKALNQLKDQFSDLFLIQMHNHQKDDPHLLRVKALIDQLKINPKVLLLRNIPNSQMANIYNLADICISVPFSDGFPVTVFEASACKIPLVVSRLPYVSEWFEDRKNGWIVKSGDALDLASAIKELKKNVELRNQFAEYNYQKAARRADYHKCMERLADLYREVV